MIEKDVALKYLHAGLSVLPADLKTKCPLMKWKTWQTQLPTEAEINSWFTAKTDAICIVCGKVSGNLEVMDFDNQGELFPKWKEAIPADLLAKLVIEQSPSGGYHVAYRCSVDEICGNVKLAQGVRNGNTTTLIETRGEGGLILCAPSEKYVLQQGDYGALPDLTHEEREKLLWAAYHLDEKSHDKSMPVLPVPDGDWDKEHPGNDFIARGDIRPVLQKHGWTSGGVHPDGNEYWRRPGKTEDSNSATLKNGVFYVFSSNAEPFEPNRGYNIFSVYALLEHNGDYSKAVEALAKLGYGKPPDDMRGVDLSGLLGTAVVSPEKKVNHFMTARELLREYKNMKEPLIDGLLRREEVMNIVAAPKMGKSWLVMQLALSLACGRPWLGRECGKSHVLLIDNELHKETISSRLHRVASAMGISDDDEMLDGLVIFSQRGGDKNLNSLQDWLKEYNGPGFDVIIIDALYKALPKDTDENSNGQITSIYNTLDRRAQETNAAIILVHHTSKGNQANKSVTDIGSGAGAQSRAPDTHLTLRQHNTKGIVSVYCCVRSFPPIEPFCLRRDENNLWCLALEEDPGNLEGKDAASPGQNGKRQMTVEEVTATIADNLDELNLPMGKVQLVETIRDNTGASKAKVESALEQICEQGLLEIRKGDPAQKQQAMKWYYKGSSADSRSGA